MAQSPVFEPKARPVGFTRRPRAGDYRTCPSTCLQSQGSSFPAGPGLQAPSQPHLCSSTLHLLLPVSPALSPHTWVSLAFSFLSPGAASVDLPFYSQDCRRVSGIGKPVLCSASRPPGTSRCPKLEESTPRLPPPLKRQVGLFPVDTILLMPAGGDFEPRGGIRGSLLLPNMAEYKIPVLSL